MENIKEFKEFISEAKKKLSSKESKSRTIKELRKSKDKLYNTKSNSSPDDEEIIDENIINEKLSELQLEYREFFRYLLKKYEVTSPVRLSEDKKKEFFNEISKHWTKGKGLSKEMKEEMKDFEKEK